LNGRRDMGYSNLDLGRFGFGEIYDLRFTIYD
jgi:hypothetical protein